LLRSIVHMDARAFRCARARKEARETEQLDAVICRRPFAPFVSVRWHYSSVVRLIRPVFVDRNNFCTDDSRSAVAAKSWKMTSRRFLTKKTILRMNKPASAFIIRRRNADRSRRSCSRFPDDLIRADDFLIRASGGIGAAEVALKYTIIVSIERSR